MLSYWARRTAKEDFPRSARTVSPLQVRPVPALYRSGEMGQEIREIHRSDLLQPRYRAHHGFASGGFLMKQTTCSVCLIAHDEEIHEATIRLHAWLRQEILRQIAPWQSTAAQPPPDLVQ